MFVIIHAQKIVFPFIFVLALLVCYRAYQYRTYLETSLTWLGVGAALLLVGISSTLLNSYSRWAHLILSGTLYPGFLIVYWALRQILIGTPFPHAPIRSPLFIAIILGSILAVGCDAARIFLWTTYHPGIRLPTLHYPRAFPVTGLSWEWVPVIAYYLLHDLMQIGLVSCIIVTYLQSMRRHVELTYLVRRLICLLGFVIGALGILSMLVGILVWTAHFPALHATLARIYHVAKIAAFAIVMCGFLIPHRWLDWLLTPLAILVGWRREQQAILIAYLQEKMMQITPSLYLALPSDDLRAVRLSIEISDARQLIWSHVAQYQPITPKAEAALLAGLLRTGTVITTSGPYTPPPTYYHDTHRYNVMTAKHLRQFE